MYSWASLLGKGNTISTNFLICLNFWKLNVNLAGMNAFEEFSKTLRWSLYWLFLGVWPKRDVNAKQLTDDQAGKPLANGFYAVLWVLRGDLEHISKAFKLNNSGSSSPCCHCKCNGSTTPWTDGREVAVWRSNLWDNTSWKAAQTNPHPIFELPGVGVLIYVPDVLHSMHLGCYMYYFGSVLEYLADYRMGDSHDNNLSRIWGHVQDYYKVQFKTNTTPNQYFARGGLLKRCAHDCTWSEVTHYMVEPNTKHTFVSG